MYCWFRRHTHVYILTLKYRCNIFWQAREKIISKINKTIEIHRQQGATQVGNGVLGRLLEEESLPDDAVADFIINLLFAGNETTAKTMLFAVYFLTHCPRAMKELMVSKYSLNPYICVYVYIDIRHNQIILGLMLHCSNIFLLDW